MKTEKELRSLWRALSDEEKAKWNGYNGFKHGQYFDKSSLFLQRKRRFETVKT